MNLYFYCVASTLFWTIKNDIAFKYSLEQMFIWSAGVLNNFQIQETICFWYIGT